MSDEGSMSAAFWGGFFGLVSFFSVLLMCWIARRAFERLDGGNGFEEHDLREAANCENQEVEP